jgi:polar amino acid transport system ATP-binding protein
VLIGASGSGKSTLLRCINGLVMVDAGSIVLDGSFEVTSFETDMDVARRRIGIVFQSYNLFPHMSVLDNVALAPRKVLGKSKAESIETARIPIGSPVARRNVSRSCGHLQWSPS